MWVKLVIYKGHTRMHGQQHIKVLSLRSTRFLFRDKTVCCLVQLWGIWRHHEIQSSLFLNLTACSYLQESFNINDYQETEWDTSKDNTSLLHFEGFHFQSRPCHLLYWRFLRVFSFPQGKWLNSIENNLSKALYNSLPKSSFKKFYILSFYKLM